MTVVRPADVRAVVARAEADAAAGGGGAPDARLLRAALDSGLRIEPVDASGDRRRLLRHRAEPVVLLAPDGRLVVDEEPVPGPEGQDPRGDAVLAGLPVVPRRRGRAARALRRPTDGPVAWRLVPGSGRSTARAVLDAGVGWSTALAGITGLVAAAATAGTFAVAGRAALDGGAWVGPWLLAATLLVLASTVHLVTAGRAATAAGLVLRRRLFDGACALEPAEAASRGSARAATALEVAALDDAAVSAGLLTAEGGAQVLVALAVLATTGPPGVVALLGLTIVVTSVAGAQVARAETRLSVARRDLSETTTDTLLGHRTRLVQSDPDADEHDVAALIGTYEQATRSRDRWVVVLAAGVPGVWQVAALVVVVAGSGSGRVGLAAALGSTLLATSGLRTVGAGAAEAAQALVAARALAPLVRTATPPAPGEDRVTEAAPETEPERPLVALRRATVRVGADERTVLDGLDLEVAEGDRLLVEGASGAGKSTLLVALAGLGALDGGVRRLGAVPDGRGGWRAPRVVLVPQFHHNHVFTGTVAFNVLMGRGWPPGPGDEARAEALCRDLGLGPLLDRMPGGMGQVLGEIGWRLSHGERSRLYVARALAQEPDVLLLDESVGALDAATLRTCLDAVVHHCRTVVLVAHP